MTTNTKATAQVIQPPPPPLPECVLLWMPHGKPTRWSVCHIGTKAECEKCGNSDGETYALVTITPPQTPASEEEIRDAYDNDDAACGIRPFTRGYEAAERRLGVRP